MTIYTETMTYDDGLDWIHQQLKFGIKPGIKRMQWMLEQLGNPQETIKGIHVVGTNGKGSTVNYLKTIFMEAGYEVGTFTSPYIMDFRERIALNGHMISKEDLVALLEIVKPIAERLPLETGFEPATEFEIITTMMFLYFGRLHPVDIAIIEAGLGGTFDSTNVFHPLAVICTSIGLDHQDILGQDYPDIAAQKVGVLKEGVPFIFSENKAEVRQVFYDKAVQTHSQVYEFTKDFMVSGRSDNFTFNWQETQLTGLSLQMLGQHQVTNASLAIMCSLLLDEDYPLVSQEVIASGLSKAKWLGRTEMMSSNVMIDGAHNKESVAALIDVLKNSFPHKNIHILFSAIKGKPIHQMLDQLDRIGSVTVTTFPFPKALDLDDYPQTYASVANFQDWLATCDTRSEKDLYVITGSLYFISQVRQYLLAKPCYNKTSETKDKKE